MKSPTSNFSRTMGFPPCRTGHRLAVGLCAVFISQTVFAQSTESKSTSKPHNDTISNQGFSIQPDGIDAQPVEQINKELLADAQLDSIRKKLPARDIKPEISEGIAPQAQDEAASVKILPRRLTGVAGLEMQSQTISVPWYRTGLGALSIVLCLMGGLYGLVRKWFPSIRVSDSRAIHVVARTTITPKHQAALIQIGRRFVLVGISGEQMNTLCEVTNPEEIAELTARVGLTQSPHATGFEKMLSKETKGFVEPAMDSTMEDLSNSDQHSQRRASWLKAPALNELKDKLRSLQHRSS